MKPTIAFAGVTPPAISVASSPSSRRAIRAIAFFEAFKGIVVLLAASGLLALVHKDLNDFAARLVRHSHLNPASKYPHIFLDAVSHLQERRLVWLAVGAATYAACRLVEAYGLFWERAWAEWLAALSAGLYLPVEIVELVRKPSLLGAVILAVNVAVVVVMARALVQRRRHRCANLNPRKPIPSNTAVAGAGTGTPPPSLSESPKRTAQP
ncbi:MAG TPA: DUF2127 domain-containing protein [Terriglobales bacterium]|nr:DUF2127 domain-containing protein [Terriglobales bacterium]